MDSNFEILITIVTLSTLAISCVTCCVINCLTSRINEIVEYQNLQLHRRCTYGAVAHPAGAVP